LQLLCEISAENRIEQSALVNQIREILESIAPRNIYRVKVNCRIVREHQLLWLDEINRNPENQLLWSEEIVLEKPSIFKQLIKDFQERKIETAKITLPKTQAVRSLVVSNQNRPQNSAWGWIILGTSLCMFFLMVGLAFYALFGNRFKSSIPTETSKSIIPITKPIESPSTNQPESEKPAIATDRNNPKPSEDYFAAAVRIANRAALISKKAKTSTQWLELAADWQRASDLMAKVPRDRSRYQEAQIRTKLYKQYSEAAQKQADKSPS
jgi:hypothetical protein